MIKVKLKTCGLEHIGHLQRLFLVMSLTRMKCRRFGIESCFTIMCRCLSHLLAVNPQLKIIMKPRWVLDKCWLNMSLISYLFGEMYIRKHPTT